MGTYQRPARRTLIIVKSAVVIVQRGENTEQAWHRHIMVHPEDTHADVKIFHFNSPNIAQNLLVA